MTDAGATPPAPIELGATLEDNIQYEREVLGEVTIDEMVKGDFGEQWHFGFRPLTYVLNTKTGAHHEYVPTAKRGARTKWGIIISSLMLALDPKPSKVGAGELIGRQLVFLIKTFNFGVDKETSQPREYDYILFKRELNDADRDAIANAGGVAQQVAQSEFDDDQINAILNVVVGLTPAEVMAKASVSKLEKVLKASVISGKAIPVLESLGKLQLGESGKYERVAELATA